MIRARYSPTHKRRKHPYGEHNNIREELQQQKHDEGLLKEIISPPLTSTSPSKKRSTRSKSSTMTKPAYLFVMTTLFLGFLGIILNRRSLTNVNNNQMTLSSTSKSSKSQKKPPPPTITINTLPKMKFFLRMSGSLKDHKERFFCYFLRSTLLFWNTNYGNEIILVLDEHEPNHHTKKKKRTHHKKKEEEGESDIPSIKSNKQNRMLKKKKVGVVVTEESDDHSSGNNNNKNDHIFGDSLSETIFPQYIPEYTIKVEYEPLPYNVKQMLLKYAGPDWIRIGYKRQLWSTFFTDIYVNDVNENNKNNSNNYYVVDDARQHSTTGSNGDGSGRGSSSEPTLLVFMDNDAMFFSPVTMSSIFDETQGYKPRVIGTDCTFRDGTVYQWVQTAKTALGLPIVADFMIAFPMYIYSDTITNCRNYLLRRYNTTDFAVAYSKFNTNTTLISPITVLFNYAWYFERDRYAWDMESNCLYHKYLINDTKYHVPMDSHFTNVMTTWPQTAFHYTYAKDLTSVAHASYCLAMEHTNYFLPDDCKMKSIDGRGPTSTYSSSSTSWLSSWLDQNKPRYTYRDNYVMFFHDLQRLKKQNMPKPSPCYYGGGSGNNAKFCQLKLHQHYNQYARQVKLGQRPTKIDWDNSIQIIDNIMSSQSTKWNTSSSCPRLT